MEKKKIIFLNNHFQYSDGTVRALIGLVNNLDPEKYEITVKPIYRCDRRLEAELREGVKLEKGFGFYFKGFSGIAARLPKKWLYNRFIAGKYDIEVGFQCGLPTRLVGSSLNSKAVHAIWVHTFAMYPEYFLKADKIVNVSRENVKKMYDELNGKGSVTWCYNIVDDEKITCQGAEPIDLNLDHHNPVFISVGRHSNEKGYIRLIRIMKELHNEGYTFTLILVGDGPQHNEIKKLVEDLQMSKYIILTGAQINPHKYTSKADVFICSSYTEGYSTACTEACILGIPNISTPVSGAKEIINDAECGLLTGMDDESLKAAIRKVLQNPELIKEWKGILKRTSQKFGLAVRKKAVNDLFDEFYKLSEEKKKTT